MKKKSLTVKNKIHNDIIIHLENKKILKVFKEFSFSMKNTKKIAVAISGGPDSLSLAFLTKCFSIKKNLDVKYYIVDHKLRKGSTIEATKVVQKLKSIDINCKILTWIGKKPKSNIQSIARNKRYSLLGRECKKNKIEYLLLGHHINDLYENFFIRLSRGSGLKGLTSFGKIADFKIYNVNLLRPLINLEKKDLIYISKKVFNFYIDDPSNVNQDFKRVRIRNLMKSLEKEGLDKKKIKLTINNLKDSDQTINFYILQSIEKNSTFDVSNNRYLVKSIFFQQPHEIVFRSLSILIKTIGKNYYPVRGKSIDHLIFKIKSMQLIKMTLGGCYIEKINETFIISKEK